MANYISGKQLFNEIVISKNNNELTPEAVNMFIKLANELSQTLKFKYDDDKRDCVAFAISDLLLYWRNFDPSKSTNAFAYFTQVTKNGLAKGFKKIRGDGANYKLIPINDDGIMNI